MLTAVMFGWMGAADEPKAMDDRMTRSLEFHETVAWAALDPGGVCRTDPARRSCLGYASVPGL